MRAKHPTVKIYLNFQKENNTKMSKEKLKKVKQN